ncbi:MAG: nucleoside kinase [Lachnospiraceae bacterium]|nr:nucleoside kinase [Lachnospiraceae bacterium]
MPVIACGKDRIHVEKGTTFEQVVKETSFKDKEHVALIYFNNQMRELSKKVETDGVLSLSTTRDQAGYMTYCRTAQMMLIKAVREVLGDIRDECQIRIEFSLGNAYYCVINDGDYEVSDDFAREVSDEMRRLSERDIPITKKAYPKDIAIEVFRRQGMMDKVKLFHFRMSSSVNVYQMDGLYDYFYGYMLPRTGYVKQFDVKAYESGLLLMLPSMNDPDKVDEFTEQVSLFEQLELSNSWGKLVEVNTVGDLNEKICDGEFQEMILVQEALQERRIADIAKSIYNREKVRFVLVAGPSSSGKTTFAHRLSVQLRSFGLHPHIIQMDDYFVNREHTPVDIDGNYMFDVIEALDLELFEDDMNALAAGETIELPTFDFKLGKRVYKGNTLTFGDDDILIIEGIHGLNPIMTRGLDDDLKFKIYISAMTSLNIDEHNRIPSSDVRLIRRMVRDARTRGNLVVDTINGWQKVRDAEEINVFPYQDEADCVFNSTLNYELAVLKHFAEPLLFNVRQSDPAFYEAKRLLKFLDYFVGVDTTAIPTNSICREFVGGSCFTM